MHFFRIFGSVDLLAIFADFHLRPALPHSRIFILASPRPATSLMHKKFTASHKNEEDKKRFKEVCKILISNTLGFCQPHLWISISKHNYYWKKTFKDPQKISSHCNALHFSQSKKTALPTILTVSLNQICRAKMAQGLPPSLFVDIELQLQLAPKDCLLSNLLPTTKSERSKISSRLVNL